MNRKRGTVPAECSSSTLLPPSDNVELTGRISTEPTEALHRPAPGSRDSTVEEPLLV